MAVLFFNQQSAEELKKNTGGKVPIGSYVVSQPPQTLADRVAERPLTPAPLSINPLMPGPLSSVPFANNPAPIAPMNTQMQQMPMQPQQPRAMPMTGTMQSNPDQLWENMPFEQRLAMQNLMRTSTGARVNIAQPKGAYS